MSQITLHAGDNRETLRRLIDEGVRVHSVVTDPPYGLTSITKRFGADKAAPAKFGTDGAFQRTSAGFMGSKWDGTGIERDPEFWSLIWEILLPGGYCLAFSSPRTGHWQACAMEMAGFVMHPFIGWAYGQGFPKAHNAGQAIEKQLTTGVARRPDRDLGGLSRDRWSGSEEGTLFANTGGRVELTTEEAQQWDGWAYGGQSLKPALEPIYVGQKPFTEKNGALNILKHGVGAINIDGCRNHGPDAKGYAYTVKRTAPGATQNSTGQTKLEDVTFEGQTKDGRHPANLLHDGSEAVREMFPATTSIGHAPKFDGGKGNLFKEGAGTGGLGVRENMDERHFREADTSAARFFNAFPQDAVVDLDANCIIYNAKAAAADRMAQCLVCDRRFVGMKPDCGCKGEDGKAKHRGHPTVKPIALMRWLQRLVTPPGGTTLDPFAGSGTSGEAAKAEGFDCILMEAEEMFAADIRFRFGLSDPLAAANDDFDALLPAVGDDFEALL